jgi:Tol biopolymer transport system component
MQVGAGGDPSLSADGRFVSFTRGDGVRIDVFVHDRTSGTTELVSLNGAGEQGNSYSVESQLSADGRFVAFYSFASNLVPGDTNDRGDVFVRDRTAGTTERVSLRASGLESAEASYTPAISADGRFVVFVSGGRLVAADKSSMADVYLRDRSTGKIERVSVGAGGVDPNGPSDTPSVSADGRFVAFGSAASNLVLGDTNSAHDVFVRDRALGTTERISMRPDGAEAAGASADPRLSADGRFVAFASLDASLAPGDTNGAWDVFLRDRQTGTTVRASGDTLGLDMSGVDFAPAISADGSSVAFVARSAAFPDPWRRQVFVYDRLTGGTELASAGKTGEPGDNDSQHPAITGDGGVVAFWSAAWNLVDGMHGGVFVRDRVDRQPPTLTVPAPLLMQGAGAAGAGVSYTVSATDDSDPNPSVRCWPPSGSLFPLGTTTVTCTATDASGNSASASFTVTVTTSAPAVSFQPAPGCKGAWSTMTAVSATGVRSARSATAVSLSPSDAWTVRLTGGEAAHWDGASWTGPPAPVTRAGAVDARTANDVWVVGRDASAHFDGVAWTTVPIARVAGATRVDLAAVEAIAPDDVWAVGTSFEGLVPSPVIEHWDGASWTIVTSPSPASVGGAKGELFAVRALGGRDVWAAGYADDHALVEHWDGTGWSVVPSADGASVPSDLRALAALSADDVWAIGRTGQAPSRPLVEHWDGTRWSVASAPAPQGGQDALLTGVAAISSADVWASGSYTSAPGSTSPRLFLVHWDGRGWSLVETGATTVRSYGGIDALPNGIVLAAATNVQQLCEVSVADSGVLPYKTSSGFGTTIAWSIDGSAAQAHSITDASGMGLFDSGLREPGGSFTYTFPAAASYEVTDSATGQVSTVSVAMTATPIIGPTSTAFTIGWAAAGLAAGFAHDVQVKRPGATAYADFLTGTADPSATFTPDAGAGRYSFRARIRNTGNGKSSGWSPAKTITVS